jgi:hypothetical protein
VSGLAGDGPVGLSHEVRVRDEAGSQSVGAVVGGVCASAGDGVLDESIDAGVARRHGTTGPN